jgi:tetratricopeptide (TPR) repeat protein
MSTWGPPFASLLTLTWLVLAVGAFPVSARAANEGQADLDKATQQKLGAQNADELTEVIQLCESALKKGLDKNNTAFANDLMASALVQRGGLSASKAYHGVLGLGVRENGATADSWKTYRSEALADLEKGVKLSPKQPQAQFEIAKLNLLPEGDQAKAMEALNKTIALADDDANLRAEALVRRALLRSNPQERLADLNEAVRTLPGNAGVLRSRALVLADAGKWDESMADFDKAIAADPKQALTSQLKAEVLRKRGLTQARAEKWDAALADFDKAIAADPKQVTSYQMKALVLIQLQKVAEALAVLEKAHTIAPENIELLLDKGKLYIGQSNYKAAAEEMTRALAIDGSNLPILELRAALYAQLGEKAKALTDVEKILTIKPGDPKTMRMRALLLADLGKGDAAVEELQNLHKANPEDSSTMLLLGMVYMNMKKFDKAIEAYSAVLADHPDDVDAMRGRADAYLNAGRRTDAMPDYEQALKLQPHDVSLLNNFAWLLATAPEDKLRDGHRAVVLAKDACRQTDYKADYILSTLAAAYAETGDFDSARKYAAQAVEAKPSENAEPNRKDELKKELESYKANKPWREDLSVQPAKKGDGKKADENKTSVADKKDAQKSDTAKKKKKKTKKPAPPPDEDSTP